MAGDKNDFSELPDRAQKAGRAIGGLTDAFVDLSEAGGFNAKTMNAVQQALGLLPGPLGAVAQILGPLAVSFVKAAQGGEDLATAQQLIDATSKATSIALDKYYTAIVNGSSEAEAAFAAEKAAYSSLFAEQRKVLEAEALLLENKNKKILESIEFHLRNVRVTKNATGEDARQARILSEVFQQNDTNARQLRDEIDELARSLGSNARAANAAAKAHKEHGRSMSGLGDAARAGMTVLRGINRALEEEARYMREIAALQGISGNAGWSQEQADAINAMAAGANNLSYGLQAVGEMAAHAMGGVAVEAFNQYADAWDRVIDGHNAFNKSSGRSFQNATAHVLKSFGQMAAMESLMELARAAAAATPQGALIYGSPGPHLVAAGMFAAAAGLAGVGTAGLSVKPASVGGSGGGGGFSGHRSMHSTDVKVFNVTIIGDPDYGGKQRVASWVAEVAAGGG